MAFGLYGLGWKLSTPFLRRNLRLADGFRQRRYGPLGVTGPLDLWIQAASAGESYLALSIVEKFLAIKPTKILITTNTRQGFDILTGALSEDRQDNKRIFVDYFPFDAPCSMAEVVGRLQPRLMVLLETEIWPALLLALKKNCRPAVILNGRLSPKSLRRYLLFPTLFRAVAPERIFAVSVSDANRYRQLFAGTPVGIMPNIKFDRITFPNQKVAEQNPLNRIFGSRPEMIVLGSIRQEEEPWVAKIIMYLLQHLPKVQIAVFPRHLHRLDAWEVILNNCGHSWVRRSALTHPVSQSEGKIILWDTFGELAAAYAMASAVFVGGSLAKLGGQNFLEPLSHGVRPVIGPYWDNFFWIGQEIFSRQLVQRCSDWQAVAKTLVRNFRSPGDPQRIISQAKGYVARRQGGTVQSTNLIKNILDRGR